MGELQRERLALAIGAVAAAEGVLADTVQYVKERKAFGAPIAELQNTRFKLAEVATDIRIHRSFVEECKQLFMRGELDVATVSMAKVSCYRDAGSGGRYLSAAARRLWLHARIRCIPRFRRCPGAAYLRRHQ